MVTEDQRKMDEKLSMGDKDAFGEVYDKYFSKVYNYIYARIKNPNDADEIVSVVFEKAFSKLHTYDTEQASFSTWLFTIAKNTMRNFLRVKKVRTFVELDESHERFQDHSKIDDKMIHKEQNQKILDALSQLSEREREVVSLKFWGALSNKEISKVTGMTGSNVGVVLHRALKNMKHTIEEE